MQLSKNPLPREHENWLLYLTPNTPLINRTDPYVVHDPELPNITAARVEQSNNKAPNHNVAIEQVHGSSIPIIDINGIEVSIYQLESAKLSLTGFTPKFEFVFNDAKDEFQFNGGLGLNNRVLLVLTPVDNGLYRKIKLYFYIKSQENLGNNKYKYICEYYHNGLWKNACTQIGDEPLTTYKFCETISKQLQLGFAATKKCEEINDKRWRQIYSQKISDYIKEQIEISGLDEESIFDVWIDPYNYLVLSNLSYIFNEDVKQDEIAMYVAGGFKDTYTENGSLDANKYAKRIKRYISNWDAFPFHQNKIRKYDNFFTTENIQKSGVLRNCWIMKNAGDTNDLEMQNIQIIENSVEGQEASSLYESETTEFLGVEMSEDTPYILQKEIRKSFILKRRSKQISVSLEFPNYGFQRGMIIFVLITEKDSHKLNKILYANEHMITRDFKVNSRTHDVIENFKKFNGDYKVTRLPKQQDRENAMLDGSVMVNPAYSGLYYIDGIEYVYDSKAQRIIQHMHLYKKDAHLNLNNIFAGKNFFTPEY